MKKTVLAGVDIGNYSNKVVVKNKRVSVDSRIEMINEDSLLDYENTFRFNGNIYKTGSGEFDETHFKVEKEHLLVNLFYSLAVALNKSCNVSLCIGLPISQYKQDKQRLIELITNNSEGTIFLNSKKIVINIESVTVLAESIGSFYSIKDKFVDYELEDITIVDIGGKTTDVCTISEDSTVKYHKTFYKGAFTSYANVKRYMADSPAFRRYFFSTADITKIIDKGLYKKGEKLDTSFTASILKQDAKEIFKLLVSDNDKILSDTILITGGHGSRLFPYINDHLEDATLHSDYIYGNAIGYYNSLKEDFDEEK